MLVTRTRIKVCGLTSAEDARAAVLAGADALGVVFAESSRQVSIEEAEEVFLGLPPFVSRIGVFVNAEEDEVAEAVARLRLHAVQFHGDEDAHRCATAPVPAIKAFKVGRTFDPHQVLDYTGCVSGVLLDTYVEGTNGGTGRAFAWELVGQLPHVAPVIVAGGLTPVNVGAAIRALRPFAVDVSSGVEERPRDKDPVKLHAFVEAVRTADAEAQRAVVQGVL